MININKKNEKLIEKHCTIISDLYRKISECKDISILQDMYSYLREHSNDFYFDGEIHWLYDYAISNIMESERLFNREYLIDNKFYLDINNKPSVNIDSSYIEILNYLVYNARLDLINMEYSNLDKNNKTWDFYHVNYCEVASARIKELCDRMGISCKILKIYPGYDKDSNLFNGIGYHYFNIIDFATSRYLIDVTYSQFFNKSVCDFGRIGLMNYPLTKAGYFMTIDDKRKEVASNILKNGYIKLSHDAFKSYMDGFTMSFRNGLYYEETKDFSYTTDYSIYDYENFLSGQDSQVKHEGIEVLGYQKKPLKNYR